MNKTIKACVPMHTFGHSCRIDEIKDICDKWNIALVEESLGSYYNEKHTGTFGKVGAFSFNGNTSGGVIVSKTSHYYSHDEIGFNYRMQHY